MKYPITKGRFGWVVKCPKCNSLVGSFPDRDDAVREYNEHIREFHDGDAEMSVLRTKDDVIQEQFIKIDELKTQNKRLRSELISLKELLKGKKKRTKK